jgi:hypothetical protein
MSTKLEPRLIHIDLDTQARVAINDDVVKEYVEAMESGDIFPPLLVYFDEPDNRYILVDGFHRFEAHRRLYPNDPILVKLELGNLEDARWASLGANKDHGLRRTNADKRNAIIHALKHPKGAELSDRQIAEHVGVHHDTVGRIRTELELSGEIRQIETRTVKRGDQIYQQNTTQIGQNQSLQLLDPLYRKCQNCRYFGDDQCNVDQSKRMPWETACNDFTVIMDAPPPREVPPPDYDHVEPCDDEDDKPVIRNPFQNRHLANCTTVHLPSNNPQLFAVELREHWDREYLIECLAALRHLLDDED